MEQDIELPWTREELERAKAALDAPRLPVIPDPPVLEAVRILLRPLVDMLLEKMPK